METSVWILILQGLQLLAIIIVGIIYRQQIQKQKDIIRAIEQYHNIIDINEINEYVKLSKRKHKLKAIEDSYEIASSIMLENSEFRKMYEKQVKETYGEHINFSLTFLFLMNDSNKIFFIDKYFPKNSDELKKAFGLDSKNS